MAQLIIAAFPQSIIKFQLRQNDVSLDEKLSWAPDFLTTLGDFVEGNIKIDEIYILGPKSYISKFVNDAKHLTKIPVFEEGI